MFEKGGQTAPAGGIDNGSARLTCHPGLCEIHSVKHLSPSVHHPSPLLTIHVQFLLASRSQVSNPSSLGYQQGYAE